MRRRLLLYFMTSFFLIQSIVFIFSVSAESLQGTKVEATIFCSFDSGSHLTVRTQMIVNRINVFDVDYDQQSIENMATTNPYVMGAIMLRLHESIKKQVETAFTNATVETINMMPTYEKPYFIDNFQISLTSAFFHYNSSWNLTDFITGVLDMGATIIYNFDLQPVNGWNMTYVFSLPSSMTFTYANTSDLDIKINTATWAVSNIDGNNFGKKAILFVQMKNPTTNSSENENISLEYILDAQNVNDISFIDSILVKKINIRRYNVLPEFITGLESIPADGIRLCIDNGLFSWEDLLENTIQPVKQQSIQYIENSSFDYNLNLSFFWEPESTLNCSIPYNLTYMDDVPAIRANFKDSEVYLTFCQLPARAFFGLINAGATASISSNDINFGVEEIMYPYNILLRLPTNISLNGVNIYSWNKTTPIAGDFTSEVQPIPPYTTERIENRIEIELLKIDLNIPSLLTGKTELIASTNMKGEDRLFVLNRTNVLSIPPNIKLTYLNADALRLCAEEGTFNETQINSFLLQKKEAFQQRLSKVIHGLSIDGSIDRKLFSNSLVWDGDITSMDDVVPVVVSNYANEAYSMKFNISLWPAEMNIAKQNFTLQSIQNQSVVYRIIFPDGITVNAIDSSGQTVIIQKTNDGRAYVELSFDENSLTQSTVLTCV